VEPSASDPPWVFAVISDLHVPPDGSIPSRLEAVIGAVVASRPNPLRGTAARILSLLSTHPPIEERIARLRAMPA
jgi:Zn-dependent protease with chaperone function